ncbi:MAG TPA: Wzz/FepE/Etk N-terminal domain-containing protein [Patescibacteria group bacterium]|nr:Wzz/FepE/Etk N-terminal domain-containing protein [Patescibacteria group bacterium]
MELREYFKIIGKYRTLFWAVVILATLLAFIFTKLQSQSYLASSTLTVNKSSVLKQTEVDYYVFDNYYNVQSSGLFSQIVTSWFESPAVVKEIYSKADIALPDVSQRKLSRTFKAIRIEPATIHVSLTGSNRDEAEKLINAAALVMQDKTNELGKSDKESVYDIVKFTPIVSETTADLWLNTLIGLIAGLIGGVILALAVDYFRKG